MSNRKVIIYQRVLPHYRVPFFRKLYLNLKESGVELIVIAGKEKNGTVPKTVYINEPWVLYSKNIYIPILGVDLTFQCFSFHNLFDDTVVVLEHSNRLLMNYFFMFAKLFSSKKVCFWGHGRNYQSSNINSLRERFKRLMLKFCDHYFSYTVDGKHLLESYGLCRKKITVVENSIDTSDLIQESQKFTANDIHLLKKSLGIDSNNIAIYCGGMYREKRLQFLIEACNTIKAKVPDFCILFIGDGPDSYLVKDFSDENHWVKYIGPLVGTARVDYFKLSKCQLMPGLVGLGILDSFALSVPLVTTRINYHSPEISYLVSGYNGLIIDDDLDAYSQAVISVLTNSTKHSLLVQGCVESAEKYTVENMASNFAKGLAVVSSA